MTEFTLVIEEEEQVGINQNDDYNASVFLVMEC